jgi:hypothetical protein
LGSVNIVNNYHSLDSLILHCRFCVFVNLSVCKYSCRIDQVTKNQYFLSSTKGPLHGSRSASQFNPVESPDQSLIPLNWPEATAKLTSTKAVQLINNRCTIGAAQKAGQLASKPGRQRDRKPKKPELEPEPVALHTSSYKRQKRTGAFEY